MRRLLLLLLLAPLGAADEVPPAEQSPYAAMGFPVTFDDEIITENDVARSIGQPLENIPPISLKRQLEVLLNRKLAERIGERLEIEVDPREVEQVLRQKVEEWQGEAKFYEQLAQQGRTLERWKQEMRQEILEFKLRVLFRNGVAPDRRKLLPARIKPTPREIRIAWEHDRANRGDDAARVRRLELVVDLDEQARKKLAAQSLEHSMEWVDERIEELLAEELAAVRTELARRPFEEVARERGVDVEAQKSEWVRAGGDSAADRFLREAEEGTCSEPIRRPQGGYRILHLVERERPGENRFDDPAVARELEERIRTLRGVKWEALLRLRALNESTVRPERVERSLREHWLATLREATEGLRRLGLH